MTPHPGLHPVLTFWAHFLILKHQWAGPDDLSRFLPALRSLSPGLLVIVVEERVKGEDSGSDISAISFDATGLRRGGPMKFD